VTRFDLDACRATLESGGVCDVSLSDDAGGYVCERVYREILALGEQLGVPALFLHVPPLAARPLVEILPPVRALVSELARQVRAQSPQFDA
jgi:pyrrolidone-carboxylate peptidase